jgi:arsenate reductase
MPNLTLYGIPNCDTVKKARNYLEARGLGYHFHDYKKAGVTAADLGRWSDVVGWERLPDAEQADIDQAKAIAFIISRIRIYGIPDCHLPYFG